MLNIIKKIFLIKEEMKRTKKALVWFWIASLFFSPLVGLLSILFLSYIEIANHIDWEASFM